MKMLYRPALPLRYRQLAAPLGVSGAIEVECSSWLEDNQWVLDVAAQDTIGEPGRYALPWSHQRPPRYEDHPRRITRPQGDSSSDVLIDENRVSVGVHRNKTGGARRLLVCLIHHLYALRLQLALYFAHVRESR